ncbi:MAG TPA: hypothetical protein VE398_18260 [Acidobacteriota bacterium]|nr:hypothetical protein [Acidobacteriota bacterium]
MKLPRADPKVLLLTLVFSCVPLTAQQGASDASSLRARLQASIGKIPWDPFHGYRLSGQFALKVISEEIRYRAVISRINDRQLTEYSSEDPSYDMSYGWSADRAWAGSHEITVQISPSQVPFTAQFDFPLLFADLIRILGEAERSAEFRLVRGGLEIYVRGRLRNGQVATFYLNSVEYFPRRVSISSANTPANAWLFTTMEPDESPSFIGLSQPSTDFEIWFSDLADMGGYRYPLRTDYVQRGVPVATFMLERAESPTETIPLRIPATLPWAAAAGLSKSTGGVGRPALYLGETQITSFRTRLRSSPWSDWKRINQLVAGWALIVSWIGPVFHSAPSMRLVGIGWGVLLLGIMALFIRRARLYKQRLSWWFVVAFLAGTLFVFAAAFASRQLHSAHGRALLTLHTSIRYAVTGSPATCRRAVHYLHNLAKDAPASSMEELGKACQAYALAYDLIRPRLTPAENRDLSKELFDLARPLYGSLQGWRSNTEAGTIAAAGLGMTGLALGSDLYVGTARSVLEKSLDRQISGGLHRAGPGPGVQALDSAVNLFYALKKTGTSDYFQSRSFQQYVQAMLLLTSPLGTLPLFGDTDLDDAGHWSEVLLKVAAHMPKGIGRQCIQVRDHYVALGRFSATGFRKVTQLLTQPLASFYADPYVLFLYDRTLQAGESPACSAVLGDGRAAVLRSGASTDSIYLALSATSWGWKPTHRDILTFDLYAYEGLLLHGAGCPGKNSPLHSASAETESSNCITLNKQSQSGTRCAGITASLLNQPLFDHVRALADGTYDYGQVQRDVVMVRPEWGHAGYFVLVDDVSTAAADISTEWYLHGMGEIATGVDRISRWSSAAFYGPRWKKSELTIAAFPLNTFKDLRTGPGTLYSVNSSQGRHSETLVLGWTGSNRLCTVLFPARQGMQEPAMQIHDGGNTATIGSSDWVSLGKEGILRVSGPLVHSGEYVIARKRGDGFPAVLMISGLEFRFGSHSIDSDKPVTISLDGLAGGILNSRPDTRIEIRSPEITSGSDFLLDGKRVTSTGDGSIVILLGRTGEHSFSRAGPN